MLTNEKYPEVISSEDVLTEEEQLVIARFRMHLNNARHGDINAQRSIAIEINGNKYNEGFKLN